MYLIRLRLLFDMASCNNVRQIVGCRVTAEQYLLKIQSALPKGDLWQINDNRSFGRFWMAIAELLASFQNSLCAAVDEFFPCQSEDLLHRHAEIWAYPVACMGYPADANQLCRWISLIKHEYYGNNIWTIKQLLAFAGVPYASAEEVQNADNGCHCDLKITLADAFFDQPCQPLRVGACCARVCDKLGRYDVGSMVCMLETYAPMGVRIYMSNLSGTQSILINPLQHCYK